MRVTASRLLLLMLLTRPLAGQGPDLSVHSIFGTRDFANDLVDLQWMRERGLDRWIVRQHGMGARDLGDRPPRARHVRAGRVGGRRHPLEHLGLVGITVAVLGEQHAVVGQADQGVAHARDATDACRGADRRERRARAGTVSRG